MIEAIDECEVDTSYLSTEENESSSDGPMGELANELIKQLNEMLIERYAAYGKGLDREKVVRDVISLNRERIKAVREHLSTCERIEFDRLSSSAAVDKLGKKLLLDVPIGSSLKLKHSEIMEEILQGLMAEWSSSFWGWESPSPINFLDKVETLMAFRSRTADLVNKWSPYIIRSQASHENSIHADFLETARKCEIVRNTYGGASGSYFMQDGEGMNHFVIKPIDEDINAYNNPNYSLLFSRMSFEKISRRAFPLAQIDTMAYQVAKIVGIPGATPEATMMVVKSEAFHDVGATVPDVPTSEKVKLCSVQRFVQGARDWSQVRNRLLREKLSLEEMKEQIDFEEFESANLLMWILGERDGHGGNVLG